jgi:hypothetical protein
MSDARILAAYLIFFGSYFVFAIGRLPWMKIDRPGAAIIGAVLMVAFRIVGAQEALASIDFATTEDTEEGTGNTDQASTQRLGGTETPYQDARLRVIDTLTRRCRR